MKRLKVLKKKERKPAIVGLVALPLEEPVAWSGSNVGSHDGLAERSPAEEERYKMVDNWLESRRGMQQCRQFCCLLRRKTTI